MAIIKYDQYGKRIVRHDPIQRDDVADDFKRAVAALVGLALAFVSVLVIIWIFGNSGV